MSVGPIRRSIGALGLLALLPVAGMLVLNMLDPVDAAQRAVLTLVGLLLLGRFATWGVDGIASAVERAHHADSEDHRAAGEDHRATGEDEDRRAVGEARDAPPSGPPAGEVPAQPS